MNNLRPLILAIGQFDGVHCGHQKILRTAVETARFHGGTAACLTFTPHVARVLNPAHAPFLLATAEQNRRWMLETGVDDIHLLPFTAELAAYPPGVFLGELKTRFPNLREIVVGENFTFGKNREGNHDTLPTLAEPLSLSARIVPHVQWRGQTISSTRIRTAIVEGDMEAAAAMLGRAFSMTGAVGHGREYGRTLGIPTANLFPDLPIRPAPGVYAARMEVDGISYAAGAFIPDPADARQALFGTAVEAHLLDFSGDLYDRMLEMAFLRRVRGYHCFSSPQEAITQIHADLDAIRRDAE
ncbi:MAG: riboflavin biosynthesis protein RibF [Verrucomicrobiota bacterium]|jgi:riboflavin kinase/FMN adenylyltransferase|nr:riboflavin biosynthesis protein RibF [Verrucomicrobiota bacterium]